MSLTTPSIEDVKDQIIAALEAQLNQTIPLFPKAFNRILSQVLAGVFILLYKYGGFIFLQMFVQTASFSSTEINGSFVTPLIAWGELLGIGQPVTATNAELTVRATVTNQTGTLLSGTQLVNADNGVTYLTIGDVPLISATVNLTIRASSDQSGGGGAGAIGNLNLSDIVSFANPLPNVNKNTVVIGIVTVGEDGETEATYRDRVISVFRNRPQGGAYADYVVWGVEPGGIINIYVYVSELPGIVDVYSEAEATVSNPDGIPSIAQLQEVLDSINLNEAGLATRRPVNAYVNSYAITRVGFDIEISGLNVDDENAVKADINAAVEEYFLDRAPYIPGITNPPRSDSITTSGVSGVVDDVVSANEGTFFKVVVSENSTSIPNIRTLGVGQKAKAENITYV